MHCLVIYSNNPSFDSYSYYKDWVNGFVQHPQLETDLLDIQDNRFLKQSVRLRSRYDLIVFAHSVFTGLFLSKRLQVVKAVLARVRGTRVYFLSNEFRNFDNMPQMAEKLGARWIISQLLLETAEVLYRPHWKHHVLSISYGFDPHIFKPTKLASERPIDIGFRGDYYPAYVGHDDRDILLDQFNDQVKSQVRTDIAVGQRFNHLEWAAFLNECRSLLGHEAGATRIDSDENIRHFLNAQTTRLTPENFRKLVLAMRETGVFDAPPSGRIAAPRNFEAMGTKTVQILLPGRYNDLLEAGVHYIELQRDFSNLDSVLETLFDDSAYHKIAERAYEDGLKYHTYENRVTELITKVLG